MNALLEWLYVYNHNVAVAAFALLILIFGIVLFLSEWER